jgi:hypothetical protein
MKKGKALSLIGPVAFYIGLLIIILAAFITPSGWLYVGLAVLGVIVGLLNITARESGPFLFATIAFIVAALGMQLMITAAGQPVGLTVPTELTRLAANITVFIGVAAVIIALRSIYEAARSK